MFPKGIPQYVGVGVVTGVPTLRESSNGKVWIVGSYSYTIEVAQTLIVEHWNGSSWETKSIPVGSSGSYGNLEISEWTYTINSKLRARLYYSVYDSYSTYTSESTTAVAATGGLSALLASLEADCSAVTFDAEFIGVPSAGDFESSVNDIPLSVRNLSSVGFILVSAVWNYVDALANPHSDFVSDTSSLSDSEVYTKAATFNVTTKISATLAISFDQDYFPDLSTFLHNILTLEEAPF